MTDAEYIRAWREKILQEQARRIRIDNRGNRYGTFNPTPKEMYDPDYLIYFNEALLQGKGVIDAHVHARKQVKHKIAAKFADACGYNDDYD